jgi:hypothetical protein
VLLPCLSYRGYQIDPYSDYQILYHQSGVILSSQVRRVDVGYADPMVQICLWYKYWASPRDTIRPVTPESSDQVITVLNRLHISTAHVLAFRVFPHIFEIYLLFM